MINKSNFFENSETTFHRVVTPPMATPDYISYANEIIPATEVDIVRNDKIFTISENGGFMRERTYVGTFTNKEGITCYVCPTDKISSRYWYTKEGVYRESDHWGKCRDCMWHLDITNPSDVPVIGFSRWADFKEIDPKTYDYLK